MGILAPVAVCLVVTVVGFSRLGPQVVHDGDNRIEMVALSLSNQSFAPYLAGNSQSLANRWDTFEWTNRGASRSSIRSFKHFEAQNLE